MGWGKGVLGSYLMGAELQCGMMKSSRDGCGDSCTSMCMYLMPLNYTHKNDKKVNFMYI